MAIWRDQDRDRLADDFFGSIAEEALSPGIASDDISIEIFAYDSVVGRSTIAASRRAVSSAVLRWVISRAIFDAPTTLP